MCVVTASKSAQVGKWKHLVLLMSKRRSYLFCFVSKKFSFATTQLRANTKKDANKCVCYHCYLNGKLATDVYIDEK